MSNPLVSIIIPVYNVEDYIVDCLESVLAQDYDKLEIIIVNDRTADNSMNKAANCIKLLQERYAVTIIEHEFNKGLSAARNTGIKAASGSYLFFLDSDDELYPHTFSSFVNIINNKGEFDLIIGNYTGSSQYDFKNPITLKTNNDVLQSFLKDEWYEMAWNKLLNSRLFKQYNLSFYEGILHEDSLFSFYLALYAESLTYNTIQTYKYRIRKNSITAKILDKNISDHLFIFEHILTIFNNANLFELFYDYLIRQCYYIYKRIVFSNKGKFIAQLRKIVKTKRKINTSSLSLSTKKALIYLPFFFSRILFLIFWKLKRIDVPHEH